MYNFVPLDTTALTHISLNTTNRKYEELELHVHWHVMQEIITVCVLKRRKTNVLVTHLLMLDAHYAVTHKQRLIDNFCDLVVTCLHLKSI